MKSMGMMGMLVVLAGLMAVDATPVFGQRRARERKRRATATMEQAGSQIQSGHWKDAVTSLADITKREPSNAEAWFLYGVALEQTGELLDAIPAYRKGSRDKVRRVRALYRLASVHATLEQNDDALDALEGAVEAGYRDYWEYHQAPEFASLREDPRFAELPTVCHYKRAKFSPDGNGDGDREGRDGDGAAGHTYTVVVPEDYDAQKAYPVLIAIQPSRIEWGLTRLWGEQARKRGWVVVEPDLVSRGDGDGDDGRRRDGDGDGGRRRDGAGAGLRLTKFEKNFGKFLDHLDEEFNAEGDKFYLAGCSAGGYSAYAVAMENPDRFHALVGLPGMPPDGATDKDLLGLKHMHVAHFVGRDDSDGWVEGVREAHIKLKKLGGRSQLTVLPQDGHIPSSLFGDEFMTQMHEIRQTVLAADATAATDPTP